MVRRFLTILAASAALARCTAEPPPDTLTGLMTLSQQIVSAGVSITPISGHTHDYGFTAGSAQLTGRAGVYVSLRSQPAADVAIGPISVSIASVGVTLTSITF